jgi:hypothetical protein
MVNRRPHRCASFLTLALLAPGAGGGTATAREARSNFTVSATVTAFTRIEQRSEPAEVVISAADLRRGYLEVTQPTRLVVRSNTTAGFALDVSTIEPMLKALVVHGLAGDQALGADGGSLVLRSPGAQPVTLSLTFRLMLVPGLRIGTYPWPMRIAVHPLDQ